MFVARILALSAAFAGLATSLSASTARAAEVVVVQTETYDNLNNLSIDVDFGLGFNLDPDGDVRCNYLLVGGIEKGDLDRIKVAIKPFAERDGDHTPRLCLNSPGGDYPEGLAIATYLMEASIGTAVPAGAICYSSCSLIFMGGTAPWKGELNRFVHVTGDVGFHAPYFTVSTDETFNGSAISEAYSIGINSIRELMALGVGNKVQRFPPELMAEMLAKGKDEVFSIDTVGKAIRFRVHIYGARANPAIDQASHCNACMNMNYGAMESYGAGGENDLCATPGVEIDIKPFPNGRRMTSDAAPRGGSCSIDVEEKGGKVSSWMFVEEDANWRDGLELAYWYLYTPSTSLATLHDGKPDTALLKSDGTRVEIPGPEKQGDDIGAALVDFVKNGYLGHGKANHETPEALFAAEVEYYDKGRVARGSVAADHASYYAKWPERLYEMIADSLQLKLVNDNAVEASFRYAFEVANGPKRRGGVGETSLTIELRDGRLEIVRETGKVVSKN